MKSQRPLSNQNNHPQIVVPHALNLEQTRVNQDSLIVKTINVNNLSDLDKELLLSLLKEKAETQTFDTNTIYRINYKYSIKFAQIISRTEYPHSLQVTTLQMSHNASDNNNPTVNIKAILTGSLSTLNNQVVLKPLSGSQIKVAQYVNVKNADDIKKSNLGKILEAALEQGHQYFPQGFNSFIFTNPETNEQEHHTIYLSNALVYRKSRKYPDQHRFEIVGKHLGSGSFGKVYKSEGKLVPTQENQLKIEASNKAIKDQTHMDGNVSIALTENELNKKLPHTKATEATITPVNGVLHSFLFSRYFPGKELFELVASAEHKPILLLLTIAKGVAFRLQEQVHNFGVVWRDLKAENIMIDLPTSQDSYFEYLLNMHHIDFGLSKTKNTNDAGILKGTPEYLSPEALLGKGTTDKSDIYALGQLYFELFESGEFAEDYAAVLDLDDRKLVEQKLLEIKSYPRDFAAIFPEGSYPDVLMQDKRRIFTLFCRIQNYKPEDRPALSDILKELDAIELSIKYQHLNATELAPITYSQNIARELQNAIRQTYYTGDVSTVPALLKHYILQLPDNHPIAIAEFCNTFRVRALAGLQSKEQLLEKLFSINNKLGSAMDKWKILKQNINCSKARLINLGIRWNATDSRFELDPDQPNYNAIIQEFNQTYKTFDQVYRFIFVGRYQFDYLNELADKAEAACVEYAPLLRSLMHSVDAVCQPIVFGSSQGGMFAFQAQNQNDMDYEPSQPKHNS